MNCNHKQLESVAAAENGMCPLCLLAAWQEKDAEVARLTAALQAANEGAARWLVERDAANARAEKAEADNKSLRDALERFAKLDLTSPISDAIAWDILNARAALKGR